MLNKKIKIKEILNSMGETELIELNNRYCKGVSDWCGLIYEMSEFDDVMDGFSPLRLANSICYGEFSTWHTYFKFNGLGNLESFESLDDVIDIDELVDYIVENKDSLYNDDIEEVIDECIEEVKGDDKK